MILTSFLPCGVVQRFWRDSSFSLVYWICFGFGRFSRSCYYNTKKAKREGGTSDDLLRGKSAKEDDPCFNYDFPMRALITATLSLVLRSSAGSPRYGWPGLSSVEDLSLP